VGGWVYEYAWWTKTANQNRLICARSRDWICVTRSNQLKCVPKLPRGGFGEDSTKIDIDPRQNLRLRIPMSESSIKSACPTVTWAEKISRLIDGVVRCADAAI